jgi:hypothetical protein
MVAVAFACGVLAACAPAGTAPAGSTASVAERNEAAARPDARTASPEICLRGRLTDEGVECTALRGRDGRLYTLVGDSGAAPAAGELCVCGRVAELSSCMQGTTIVVTRIGPPDGCP